MDFGHFHHALVLKKIYGFCFSFWSYLSSSFGGGGGGGVHGADRILYKRGRVLNPTLSLSVRPSQQGSWWGGGPPPPPPRERGWWGVVKMN
jgi:hypothetical protein